MSNEKASNSRQKLLERMAKVGRENSDATVLFHSTIASLIDLHPTDYKVLGIIERLGALSAGDIARHSGLATASVTDLIDRLERKGFVRRVRDEADRRKVMVESVVERIAAARVIFSSSRKSLAQLLDRYSERDLAVIADFLERNAKRLVAETEQLSTPARRASSKIDGLS